MFDGLYALAVNEALQNSVEQISDGSYGNGAPISLGAFQTGAQWTYVWTRDLSYSTDLALAGFDPERAQSSLLFKTSPLKTSVAGGTGAQIIQDTGSGGSYPVSTDRVVWSLGAAKLARFLPDAQGVAFVKQAYPILRGTLEQDRRLVYDPADGLYRGEESFLDWREQTYPAWTKDNVLPIAESEALSTNCAHYGALRTASEFATRLGLTSDAQRYTDWASALKQAINTRLFDASAGLYSSYLLTDGSGAPAIRAHCYDLLGESMAILFGIAPQARARQILAGYPTGPYGPPVVWPEQCDEPIYHNHAIWPFVTAYWIKAARQAGDIAAVDNGIASLMRGAAMNLSNMENLDVGTGEAQVSNGVVSGPVIDSRRQIWSVAGYLSMVQDVILGLEASSEGIRFQPFVTARTRNILFPGSNTVELQNYAYRGKRITVRLHLPVGIISDGVCSIKGIQVNGKQVAAQFFSDAALPVASTWDIFLAPPIAPSSASKIKLFSGEAKIFAPAQPQWDDGMGAVTPTNGRLVLRYQPGSAQKVSFDIYRDGQLVAQQIRSELWTDPASSDFQSATHFYTIDAYDLATGNTSHLTQTRAYTSPGAGQALAASRMQNRGGHLAGDHFEDWGASGDELAVNRFTVPRDGRYLLRAEYSNGAGPINTGIACGVKRLEITDSASSRVVAGGYLIMPQTGDWNRFLLSSTLQMSLKAGQAYSLRIFEDSYCRNMSYLAKNARYTANSGGGDTPYNFVNIAGIHLLRVSSDDH